MCLKNIYDTMKNELLLRRTKNSGKRGCFKNSGEQQRPEVRQ